MAGKKEEEIKTIKIVNPLSMNSAVEYILKSGNTILLVRSPKYTPHNFMCEVDVSKLKAMMDEAEDGIICEFPVNSLEKDIPITWLTSDDVNKITFYRNIPEDR